MFLELTKRVYQPSVHDLNPSSSAEQKTQDDPHKLRRRPPQVLNAPRCVRWWQWRRRSSTQSDCSQTLNNMTLDKRSRQIVVGRKTVIPGTRVREHDEGGRLPVAEERTGVRAARRNLRETRTYARRRPEVESWRVPVARGCGDGLGLNLRTRESRSEPARRIRRRRPDDGDLDEVEDASKTRLPSDTAPARSRARSKAWLLKAPANTLNRAASRRPHRCPSAA